MCVCVRGCVGVCVCVRVACLWPYVCQPACTCYPALHLITLHSRSILLHPATNMYVTSPSILSPPSRSATTASASASDCLWWLTFTQPALILVCPSCYKSLMMCVFMTVCILLSAYTLVRTVSSVSSGFGKLDEKRDYEAKQTFLTTPELP